MRWDRGRHTLSNNTPGFVEVSIIAYDLGSDHECRVEETMAAGTMCGNKPCLKSLQGLDNKRDNESLCNEAGR